MKLSKEKLDWILKDLEGTAIKKDATDDATLRNVATLALTIQIQDDNATGEEKYNRYNIANKLNSKTEEIELTSEEISTIKRLIGKAFSSLVVGQCYDVLEGKL